MLFEFPICVKHQPVRLFGRKTGITKSLTTFVEIISGQFIFSLRSVSLRVKELASCLHWVLHDKRAIIQ